MKIFVISPVRNLDEETKEILEGAIANLEMAGHILYIPYKHTKQDCSALEICRQNREAIINSDKVAIWYDPESEGSIFDLGMAFAYDKPLMILNMIMPTPKKSFANLILEWMPDGDR